MDPPMRRLGVTGGITTKGISRSVANSGFPKPDIGIKGTNAS
jgi:hypothetical protein